MNRHSLMNQLHSVSSLWGAQSSFQVAIRTKWSRHLRPVGVTAILMREEGGLGFWR